MGTSTPAMAAMPYAALKAAEMDDSIATKAAMMETRMRAMAAMPNVASRVAETAGLMLMRLAMTETATTEMPAPTFAEPQPAGMAPGVRTSMPALQALRPVTMGTRSTPMPALTVALWRPAVIRCNAPELKPATMETQM